MKSIPIFLLGVLAFSTSVQASHDLIKQPAASQSQKHYDLHDLEHWMLGYPQVYLSLDEGVATLTGHVDSRYDAAKIVAQVEKTAGVRRVTNLISVD